MYLLFKLGLSKRVNIYHFLLSTQTLSVFLSLCVCRDCIHGNIHSTMLGLSIVTLVSV